MAAGTLALAGLAAVLLPFIIPIVLRGERAFRELDSPLLAVFLPLLILIGYACGWWLWHLPRMFRGVTKLLEKDEPVLMKMTFRKMGEGETRRRYVELSYVAEARKPILLELDNWFTPGWLRDVPAETKVLVHGLPPPGPYLIELPDGRLALFDPDDAVSR